MEGVNLDVEPTRDQVADLDNTIVIIPVLNEEDSLGLVLESLPPVREVIVADNGSQDRSREIAKEYGATVVEQPERGYGAACLQGLAYVNRLSDPPGIIVFLDGDFSDHPEEIHDLVYPIQQFGMDMVIGSRMTGERQKGAMPPQSIFGNRLACFLMRLLWGARYTDLGPFRAIRYSALNKLGMADRNFGWTIEMQIKAVEQKLNVTEVPVSYRRRIGQSKISGTFWGSVRAGYKILWTIFRYRFLRR